MNKKILKEVKAAFCDSNPNVTFESTLKKRNLHFKASAPVSREDAVEIMAEALHCKTNLGSKGQTMYSYHSCGRTCMASP